jgi:hypothetical protein
MLCKFSVENDWKRTRTDFSALADFLLEPIRIPQTLPVWPCWELVWAVQTR